MSTLPLLDSPSLVVRTVPLDLPGDLLAFLPPMAAPDGLLSWVRRGEGLVGWGCAARLSVSGPERFAEADAWWRALADGAVVRDDVQLPGTGPVVFGTFTFADQSSREAALVVPEIVIGRRGDKAWLTVTSVGPTVPSAPEPVAYQDFSLPTHVDFIAGSRGQHEWSVVVAEAVARINADEVDKVVLARDVVAVAAEAIDARAVLQALAERYDTTWVFAVDGLIGATPELLVRRDQGLVTSRVLAGTIRRTGDDERDLALAASLARSSKDLEEHEYAVRSVADALAPHCSSMNVPEAPFVLHLNNVMHLATDVAGVSADAASSLALGASLHPSAAVGGTPTREAVALIAQIEGMDRERYAGPVGWMDARGDGEWGIALRCGQLDPIDPSKIRLYAGCGIVAGSDPEAEVAESSAKFEPMRAALSGE